MHVTHKSMVSLLTYGTVYDFLQLASNDITVSI